MFTPETSGRHCCSSHHARQNRRDHHRECHRHKSAPPCRHATALAPAPSRPRTIAPVAKLRHYKLAQPRRRSLITAVHRHHNLRRRSRPDEDENSSGVGSILRRRKNNGELRRTVATIVKHHLHSPLHPPPSSAP
nr:hypothetical protein Iba_chr07fCG7280 [Ipomoea batatas]